MVATPVLVTGGCGFVGARLCARLVADGHEVIILDDCSLGTTANLLPETRTRATFVNVDIRDTDALSRHFQTYHPHTVIHLAAIHFIPACNADPRRAIDVNVTGTQAVFDACVAAGSVESLVVASSAAAYAPSETPLTEESPLGPVDVYGLTKRWVEDLAALFHRRTSIPVGIARFFNIFGPGETNPHLIPDIIAHAQAGPTLRLGNLASKRDYIYLDDIVDGVIALAATCPAHGSLTCNLGSERATDGWELVRLIERLSGRSLVVTQDPARFRPADNPLIVSDCTRAHELLNWYPKMSLEDGLVEAWRQPRALGLAAPHPPSVIPRTS